jgi:hypothetical protein
VTDHDDATVEPVAKQSAGSLLGAPAGVLRRWVVPQDRSTGSITATRPQRRPLARPPFATDPTDRTSSRDSPPSATSYVDEIHQLCR